MNAADDSVELSRRLIRCPSVTPMNAGALDVLQAFLEAAGFACRQLPFSTPGTANVDNLYARIGKGAPNFCFAGHTDVVPPGDLNAWSVDPFAAEVRNGRLYGRGAADMKCAIAAFAVAAARHLKNTGGDFPGSMSLLITGDEEGPAINGTVKVLEWMKAEGETIDACLVGEPTCAERLGDMIKIGRRGSLNATIAVNGVEGHVAYPQHADNPVPRLLEFLVRVGGVPLDDGNEHFPPSNVVVTTVDVGNTVTNMIPARAEGRLNIRFNDRHTGQSLSEFLERCREETAGDSELEISVSGEAFLTPPGRLSEVIATAAAAVTGLSPEMSTTGGTSDARFIKDHCPVAEFGMPNLTAHKVDENVETADIEALSKIYSAVLAQYFEDI